ncbi:MAG: hypothetical protein IPK39_13455 [Sulfuritalea sp.]|nr:hypothetical protein [Sulfuritalea sp.]
MGGRAKLVGNGNSIAQMLASANGEAALIMDGGTVGELMLRLSNLDIANSLVALLGGDKQVPILCMVGNFKAVDGDFMVEALVLDTSKVNITGSGNVNFIDESLHLRLVSQSKGFSLASLRGPIAVTGSFKNPVLRPELGGVIARSGLALALGAATGGLGALIPLLDFGKDRDSNCAALVSQAKSDAGVKASDMSPRVRKCLAKCNPAPASEPPAPAVGQRTVDTFPPGLDRRHETIDHRTTLRIGKHPRAAACAERTRKHPHQPCRTAGKHPVARRARVERFRPPGTGRNPPRDTLGRCRPRADAGPRQLRLRAQRRAWRQAG